MIELHDVSVRLGERVALDGVNLSCGRGELVAVLGPNGAGKTTLLKAIAGLLPVSGRISIAGQATAGMSATARAKAVAYLPQGHVAHWPISAREAVAIGRMPHGSGSGRLGESEQAAIARALDAVDATALGERVITELSGGERARIMLARALAVEAPVLLADEPTAALDPAHQIGVMELVARAARGGATVFAALHDLTLAARYATRVLVLQGGRIVGDGAPGAVLTPALLGSVFGLTALHLEHDGSPVLVPWLTQAPPRR